MRHEQAATELALLADAELLGAQRILWRQPVQHQAETDGGLVCIQPEFAAPADDGVAVDRQGGQFCSDVSHERGLLAPRARAPPELETHRAGTAAFAFDQSPSWDAAAAPPNPGYRFDKTLN